MKIMAVLTTMILLWLLRDSPGVSVVVGTLLDPGSWLSFLAYISLPIVLTVISHNDLYRWAKLIMVVSLLCVFADNSMDISMFDTPELVLYRWLFNFFAIGSFVLFERLPDIVMNALSSDQSESKWKTNDY